jgi:hypothetical protein
MYINTIQLIYVINTDHRIGAATNTFFSSGINVYVPKHTGKISIILHNISVIKYQLNYFVFSTFPLGFHLQRVGK